MFHQNDDRAPLDFQHYACLFSDLLYARHALGGRDWDLFEAIEAWVRCRALGHISGDLNGDGDYDDPGEDEIQNFNAIFRELKLPLRAVAPESLGLPMGLVGPSPKQTRRILPTAEPLDLTRYWVVEGWRWKILHFVVGDGTGRRPVRFDSIAPGSLTVARGRVESLRVFEIVA